jgi:hypothetical protein
MKYMILCCALLIGWGEPLDAQTFNKGGRTAMQFLKIGVGARQVATGEACIASVQDVNAAFWNPAGIGGIQNAEASFSYASWFADLSYLSGAVAFRWDGVGVFAVSYATLDYGSLDEALVTVSGGGSDTRTGNTFSGGDLMVGLSFSRAFTPNLHIGGTAKLIREKLFLYSEQVVAFDVGTFYDTYYNGIRIAMSAQNFAGSVKWLENSDREEGYDIPLVFRIGTSANIVGAGNAFADFGDQHRLTVNLDAIHTNDYIGRFHVGGEYEFSEFLSLRGGYRFNYDEGNLAVGFGLKQQLGGMQLRFDYAYVSFKYLDSPHRLTLSMAF